jgi:hypothetical protein
VGGEVKVEWAYNTSLTHRQELSLIPLGKGGVWVLAVSIDLLLALLLPPNRDNALEL